MDNDPPTVLILGAGVNGAALARELLLAGVGVCLVDTADLASGTTAYSSRLIHGGLRYLEYADFALVRESLEERRRLLRRAPQFVRPLQLAIPISSRGGGLWAGLKKFIGMKTAPAPRGLWIVRAGLTLYDCFARDPQLPKHAVRSFDAASRPRVDAASYRWLCFYWDAQIQYPERFVLALLEDARRLAVQSGRPFRLLTYHRAKLAGTTAHVYRNSVDDVPVLSFTPAAVVNATGAWVDATLRQLKISSRRLMRGTKGSHFVTCHEGLSRALDGCGVYAEAADGRPVFLLPLGPRAGSGEPPQVTLVGTTDEPYMGDPAEAIATPAELRYLLDTVNRVIPEAQLTGDDVELHYSGVRPLPYTDASTPAAITRRHAVVENKESPLPLYSIVGGKLTTCRSLAEEAAAIVLKRLRRPAGGDSRERAIPGGESYPSDDAARLACCDRMASQWSLSREQVAAVWELLGTRTQSVFEQTQCTADDNLTGTHLPRPIVRWIIEHEWVTTLDDLVERRLMLLNDPRLSRACLRDAAELLAASGHIAEEVENAVSRTVENLHNRYGKRVRDSP